MPSLDGVDVFSLSDHELSQQLRSLGVDVGPIVDTTRKVYQKKLQKLISDEVQVEARYQPEPEEEFEEDDESETMQAAVEMELSSVRKRHTDTTSTGKQRSSSRKSKRYAEEELEADIWPEEVPEEEIEDVVDSVYTNVNYRTAPRMTADQITTQAEPPKSDVSSNKQGYSLWLQLGILVLVAVIIFLVIQNLEPANYSPIGRIDSEV